MIARLASSKDAGERCRSCPRKIREGETILVQNLSDDVSWKCRTIRWHAACVQRTIDRAPEPVVRQRFDEIRDRMVTTGKAFPNAS